MAVADSNDRDAAGLPEDGIRPAGDDPAYDPDIQDAVRDTLRDWSASVDAEPFEPVPAHVWERITWPQTDGYVSDVSSAGRRRLPRSRWTTPLIAASVVALGVAVGASVWGPFGEPTGDGVTATVASQTMDEVVEAPELAESLELESLARADSVAVPTPQVVQAGFIPPAKKVMDLGEDISSAQIADTVGEILTGVGITEPADVLEMPEETWDAATDGMTSDPKVLRNCVTKVTAVETSQALLVLRASVNGIDAGLLVVPDFMVDMNKMLSMNADQMRSMGPDMGVTTIYVVEPTCGTREPSHNPTLFKAAFTLAP
jgi:hypothetical protein